MPTNKELLGNAGEKIINKYFAAKSVFIEPSVDPYDRVKDFKIYGDKKLEVKCQVPFVTKKCFTIKDNHQLKKCLNADYLFFVQAPCKKKKEDPIFNEAAIYQFEKGWTHFKYITKAGTKMILIPMIQTAVVKIGVIEGEDKEILKKYGTDY